jgi:hypothetical protein
MKPFLSGRPQVPASTLQPLSDKPPLPSARILGGHKHAPGTSLQGPGATVECIKQGDKVARLVVTCACGEKIEIECLYPAAG